jgi:DNA-binding transcriptional ArsR family regulator
MSTTTTHKQTPDNQVRMDLVFAALSNQTRRAILARLGESPAKITDLAAPYNMSLPGVSKHLRVLEKAGLIRRIVDGRVHRCSLETSPLQEAEGWLSERRIFWNETLDALADHVGEQE